MTGPNPSGLCMCGCGEATTPPRWGSGPPSRFRAGHNRRASSEFRYDPQKNRWYVVQRNGRRYLWYRVVMWNELGRELLSTEVVHHKNGDSADDRPENLEALKAGEHSRLHCDADPEFTKERARRANSVASRNRDTRVEVACAHCGISFLAPRWRRERYRQLFCGWDCANEARREGSTGIKWALEQAA